MTFLDIPLLIAVAEIKKQSSRHGSMSQRWWQNRIYGLQFATHNAPPPTLRTYVLEAIRATETNLENPNVSRSAKNNLKGYLNGLRDAKLALEQQEDSARTRQPRPLLPQTSGPDSPNH